MTNVLDAIIVDMCESEIFSDHNGYPSTKSVTIRNEQVVVKKCGVGFVIQSGFTEYSNVNVELVQKVGEFRDSSG